MPNTELRREILRIANRTKEGHVPSCFSVLDILVDLIGAEHSKGILKHDPKNPKDQSRDRFVLSKGHAALGFYAVLAQRGFFPKDELETFCHPGSLFEGHPNNDIPGVECSTGSLGHGFPMAVGLALALKIKHLQPSRVFCLVGDGELSEGSCWESVILAAHLRLDNLVVIVDANHSNPVTLPIIGPFGAFGWHTADIYPEQLKEAMRMEPKFPGPWVYICRTTKGKGCKPMEDNPEMWHHRLISDAELPMLLEQCQ